MGSKVHQLLSEAALLFSKFEQASEATGIDEAILLDREALNLCRDNHPELRFLASTQLAGHLWCRYQQLEATDDLNEAIVLNQDALTHCSLYDTDRSAALSNLAFQFATRFKRFGGTDDLDEAVVLEREALSLCPPGHPERSTSLSNLALYLSLQCFQHDRADDLNEAISLSRDMLALLPPGSSGRSTPLSNHVLLLLIRYDRFGEIDDLNEVISLSQGELQFCPLKHPDQSTPMISLAAHLFTRFKRLGEINDLDEAIVLTRGAVDLQPLGNQERLRSLSDLAAYLSTRYSQLGKRSDLEEAIVLERDALAICPPDHPERLISLNNLTHHLFARYKQLGDVEDLNVAISLARETLGRIPQGHLGQAALLNNLALYLSTRYDQLRGIDDLNEAIVHSRGGLELSPPDHMDTCLNNLASYLSTRYSQLGGIDDLNEAILLARDAIALCPPVAPERPACLNNLATHLATRYDHLREIDDLNAAIDLGRNALELCPPGHPNQSTCLSNLTSFLTVRYEVLGEIDDVDEASRLGRGALALRQPVHPGWSTSLSNLAKCLYLRFIRLGGVAIQEELFSLYSQLEHVSPTTFSSDLSTSKEWIDAAEYFQHPTLLPAYETALRILSHHVAILPSLPKHHAVLKSLSSSLSVDAFSACLRNQSATKALELLEQGRGVFWSQLARLRSPLDGVTASSEAGKALADEFAHITSLIRNALDGPDADQHDRVFSLNVELQRVVSNIRELPGFSRFLLPPSFSDLQRAASEGPVMVINASKYSCDALVVFADKDPVHIPLSITRDEVRGLSLKLRALTKSAKLMDITRDLGIFLRGLWDKTVSHIVDVLLKICPLQSRIWLCPTAEFSLLPLHAAGPFRKGQRNFSDLFILSYTPTLTALIRTRRSRPPNPATQKKRFIAIGQASASGANELPWVGTELANIGRHLDNHVTFRRTEGRDSCISRVSDELEKNEWVHMACHGVANQKAPFESAFSLHDGKFTIQHIIRCDLQDAEFAYLSACHTMVGDEESPDEMIHLASAMQFVGFRSVIGTMWAVDDAETNEMTSVFYRHMIDGSGHLDHTRAAFALRKTIKSVHVPFDQRILYVHLGA